MKEKMRKMMTKAAAAIMSVFMILSVFTVPAFADGINTGESSGTSTLVKVTGGLHTLMIVMTVIVAVALIVFFIWYKHGGKKH